MSVSDGCDSSTQRRRLRGAVAVTYTVSIENDRTWIIGMYRIGLGHDTHRLALGHPLIIGGVHVPHDYGPDAHSDGDVLFHALTDALLGALALGDIGELFPDRDPKFADMDSSIFVSQAVQLVDEAGYRTVNVDATVFLQQPKLSAFKQAMVARTAELLGIRETAVSVKAKTGERIGPIGREEAIGAEVAVLLAER